MNRRRTSLAATLLLSIAGAVGSASAQDEAAARDAFATLEGRLQPHFNGFYLDDDPEAAALLAEQWSAVGQWASDYLSQHASASEAELAAAIGSLSPTLDAEVVVLAERSFLVSTRVGETGTVFIVAAQGDRFAPAWSIAESAPRNVRASAVLAAWSAERARGNCRASPPKEPWTTCGALFGRIGKLPDQTDGRPRFYVDATYAQEAGATVGAQLSVWTWTGASAEPLFTTTYAYMIDQQIVTRLEGDILRLRIKDEFKSFSSCGACEGRQVDRAIRIAPDRIDDLGETSLAPELDVIDALFTRLLNGDSAADLADPAVVKALEARVEDAQSDALASGSRPGFGMLNSWNTTDENGATKVCVSTDDGGTYRFTIERQLGAPWIASAEDLGDVDCVR
jgi:hypothetical protein